MKKLVCYIRVSTEGQGRSALGLEAQQAAVADYARATGSEVVKTYVEIETGRIAERPELKRAMAHAKRCQGVLCVAKLDRLSRNVSFMSSLMETGVEFVCCDNPHANKLCLHIMIAFAEDECRRISERTRAALGAYRARGGKLGAAREGSYKICGAAAERGRRLGADAIRQHANEAYTDLYPVVLEKREAGMTLQNIADALNGEGYVTRRGKPWQAVQVMRVLERAARP